MQEEVNNGAAQVVVKVGKLSGRLLKAAVAKVLKAWQEKSDPQKLHRGKQTVKQLAAQNKGMSSIDVDKAGIRSSTAWTSHPRRGGTANITSFSRARTPTP